MSKYTFDNFNPDFVYNSVAHSRPSEMDIEINGKTHEVEIELRSMHLYMVFTVAELRELADLTENAWHSE